MTHNLLVIIYESGLMTQSCLAVFLASILCRIDSNLNGSSKHIPPTMYVILLYGYFAKKYTGYIFKYCTRLTDDLASALCLRV